MRYLLALLIFPFLYFTACIYVVDIVLGWILYLKEIQVVERLETKCFPRANHNRIAGRWLGNVERKPNRNVSISVPTFPCNAATLYWKFSEIFHWNIFTLACLLLLNWKKKIVWWGIAFVSNGSYFTDRWIYCLFCNPLTRL